MSAKICRFNRALATALAALGLLAALTAAPWAGRRPLTDQPFPQRTEDKIDLNTAPAAELQCLPGVGEKRAQAIVAFRQAHGAFTDPAELAQIRGISQAIARTAAPYVTVR